jgi:DnaJ domain
MKLNDETCQPRAALAKVGASKWFWVFWENYRDCFDGKEPRRHGFSDSYESAVESCGGIDNLTDSLGRYSPWAHFALEWRSIYAARRRKPNPEAAPDVHVTEYLWHSDHYAHTSVVHNDSGFHRHRILRKTGKKVFVNEDCTGAIDDAGGVFRVKARALNRADLEEKGFAPVHDRRRSNDERIEEWGEFYVQLPEPREREVPECLAFLGLKPPATTAQVKRAFRKRSRQLHPDAGGDAERFRVLYEHYEAALSLTE